MCLLHTTAGEVVDGSLHLSVFRFQFIYAGFFFSEGNNLTETVPGGCCLVTLHRYSRNMKGGIFYVCLKCEVICIRHILCIAIDIKDF